MNWKRCTLSFDSFTSDEADVEKSELVGPGISKDGGGGLKSKELVKLKIDIVH